MLVISACLAGVNHALVTVASSRFQQSRSVLTPAKYQWRMPPARRPITLYDREARP